MSERDTVYLAWQAPETRSWHVVGALRELNGRYEFQYTRGVLADEKFVPFSGMDDINKIYVSDELFPLFRNRLLSRKRPEYPHFIRWLGLTEAEATPLKILARSGASRGTDQLQMFNKLEIGPSGIFEHYFFAHGLSHLAKSAQKRVDSLHGGEALYLCRDCQNPHDKDAVLVRADKPSEIVGYCPRYLAVDMGRLLEGADYMTVEVERVASDAPINYRLMCKVQGRLSHSNGDASFQQDEYKFVV